MNENISISTQRAIKYPAVSVQTKNTPILG